MTLNLDESNAQAILDSITDVVYVTNLDGIVIYWNNAAHSILEFSPDEIIGQHVNHIIPAGKMDEITVIEEKVNKMETFGPADTSRLTKKKSEVEFSITVSPVIDKNKQLIGIVTVARELTLLRKAIDVMSQIESLNLVKNEQTKSDRRMRKFLDLAPEPIIVINRQSIIVFANSRVREVLGYSRDELKGKHLDILIPKGSIVPHRKLVENYFASPEARPMGRGRFLSTRHKDGREIQVEISLSPIDIKEEGTFVGIALREKIEQ